MLPHYFLDLNMISAYCIQSTTDLYAELA